MLAIDPRSGARRGRMTTGHGVVETPAFMPVGTQATVKTLLPEEVRATGAQIILANTYHLMLRPGLETLVAAGGLHRFMGWDGPILTDSGGFQIFSLAGNVRVRENGVTFRSHIDGSHRELTPESAVEHAARLGIRHRDGARSSRRSARGSRAPCETPPIAPIAGSPAASTRSQTSGVRSGQHYLESARAEWILNCGGKARPQLPQRPSPGCAIGGLSVGEPKPVMAEMLEIVAEILPIGKPRYLMGVGSPEDIWMGVARGVDLFDCVLPTRLARNGALFTPRGTHQHQAAPIRRCSRAARSGV